MIRDLFSKSFKEFDITLDHSVKTIQNYYGDDTVDAAFKVKGKLVSLGINFTDKGGVELVGDIYGTGLGRDGGQETLMNKIAQTYQKHNIKKVLDENGWTIENEVVNNGKIEIEVYQF